MPYIKKENRALLALDDWHSNNPGELNYEITLVIKTYMRHQGLSYQTINDIVGALEGAKAEFQRRVVAPYEDTKIKENGDVY